MNVHSACCFTLLLAASARPMAAHPSAQAPKIPIAQPSELPRHVYAIQGKPSEVLLNHAAVLVLAVRMEQDLQADLARFEVQDKSALMGFYSSLYVTGMLRKDPASARHYLNLYRSLLENPTQRLTAGLVTEPLMDALDGPGEAIHARFRDRFSKRIAALPFDEVEGTLRGLHHGQKASSKEQIVNRIAAGLDPIVKDAKLSEEAAGALLVAAMNLYTLLPFRREVVACLEDLLAAHQSGTKDGKVAKTPLGTTQIKAKGPYFGQPLPGEIPVRFAPEVLAEVSPWASGVAFSPDGTECFLHVGEANYGGANLYVSECVAGIWTPLTQPAFLKKFTMSCEPVYSKDGRTLIFTGKKGSGTTDFWTVTRTEKGWGEAVALPSPINSEAAEFRGSFTADGTFYFGSDRFSPGINQVCKATRTASHAWAVERLGVPINAMSYEGDPCVAPDGRFLIFYTGRIGGFGRVDNWVSFRDGKGGWGAPINLGAAYNGPDDEFGACLSSDGRYLFFNRHTAKGDQLYWVAVSAIDKLKP